MKLHNWIPVVAFPTAFIGFFGLVTALDLYSENSTGKRFYLALAIGIGSFIVGWLIGLLIYKSALKILLIIGLQFLFVLLTWFIFWGWSKEVYSCHGEDPYSPGTYITGVQKYNWYESNYWVNKGGFVDCYED